MKKILFICTGNSCRSPMAAGLMKKMAREKNMDVISDSCGICALRDMPASKDAADILHRRENIDISGHRSKPVNQDMLQWADLILVMEQKQREKLLEDYRSQNNKIHLLTAYAREGNRDIADPIGKPAEVYEGLLLDLKFYLAKILERIKDESGHSK